MQDRNADAFDLNTACSRFYIIVKQVIERTICFALRFKCPNCDKISQGLRAACYRRHIRLMNRPVGDPAPGGIIERLIQTAQNQFETEVRSGDMLTLDQINCALAVWLNQAYHHQIHSETNQAP